MTNVFKVRDQAVGSFEEQIDKEFYGVVAAENSSLMCGRYSLVVVTDTLVKAYRTMFDTPELYCPIDLSRSGGAA